MSKMAKGKNYKLKELVKAEETVQTANIKGATRNTKKLDIIVENDINVLISQESENSTILPEINLNNKWSLHV